MKNKVIILVLFILCSAGIICWAVFFRSDKSLINNIEASVESESHSHEDMTADDWVYYEADYVDTASNKRLSEQEFVNLCKEKGLEGFEIVAAPDFMPYDGILYYEATIDGYMIPGMSETKMSVDEYNAALEEYNRSLEEYNVAQAAYKDNQQVMINTFGSIYVYEPVRYVSKHNPDEWTTVEAYNESYKSDNGFHIMP